MPQLPGRALAKISFLSYQDVDEKGNPIKIKGKKFIALYNPTTFSFGKEQQMEAKYLAGGGAGILEHKYSLNRTLTMDLFFDGTGASPPLGVPIGDAFGAVGNLIGGSAGSITALAAQATAQAALSAVAVTKLVNKFFAVATGGEETLDLKKLDPAKDSLDKAGHKPRYLKIMWGKGLRFNCQLKSGTVNYTLFNQLGQPIRATVSATFMEVPKPAAKQSPDLTKIYLVKAGDTLYNIAKAEYDSESFYLQIAQANDLKNYRKLVPGQTLVLPPISKTDSE